MRIMTWTLALLILVRLTPSSWPDEPKPDDRKAVVLDTDAALPEGYPGPTQPDKIAVKHYPPYRSAVARVDRASLRSGDMLFWPLFNHIQKNDIAMTAPVINTYGAPALIDSPEGRGAIEMEFPYRTATQGKTGKSGLMVEVQDRPAMDCVALGIRGEMSDEVMRDGLARLRRWLDDHKDEWVAAGPPRRLGYHGPNTPVERRLWEVQLPIEAAKP